MIRSPGHVAVGTTLDVQFANAWVNFNGLTGGPIRDQRNVTSATRTGTGAYTITLSRAFRATEYISFGAGAGNSAAGGSNHNLLANTQNTATSMSFESRLGNGTLTDRDVICIGFLGRP